MFTRKVTIGTKLFMISFDTDKDFFVLSPRQLERFRREFIEPAPWNRKGQLEAWYGVLERNPTMHEMRCINAVAKTL